MLCITCLNFPTHHRRREGSFIPYAMAKTGKFPSEETPFVQGHRHRMGNRPLNGKDHVPHT